MVTNATDPDGAADSAAADPDDSPDPGEPPDPPNYTGAHAPGTVTEPGSAQTPGSADADGSRADVAVAAAAAVATWPVVLLGVGVVLRLRASSLSSLLTLAAVALMAWPIYRLAPWRPGAWVRGREWIRRHAAAVLLAAALLLLAASPFRPEPAQPLLSLLGLPLRSASGFLFGPALWIRRGVHPDVGAALFRFGQWYVEAVVLYLVASIVVDLGRYGRRAGP